MESACTAVYISPNKCSYAGGKCLFKSFSGWGTDHNIRGYNGQNFTETLCCGFSVLESWCHGTLSFCRILTPISPIFCHSRLFFFNSQKGSRAYFHSNVISLLLEKTRVIFQVSMTLIKNNMKISGEKWVKNVMDSHVYICRSLLSALCGRIKIFKTIFTL